MRQVLRRGISFISRQLRPFKVNLVNASIRNFFYWLTRQYQSLFIVGLGADVLQLGIVNSVGGIAGAVMSVPTGWLADKHGIKAMMLVGMSIMVSGSLCFALSSDWVIAIPAMLLAMLGLRIAMTVCPMVCGSCLKNEERATGMQLCDTLTAIPQLFSPLIGAFIVAEFGGLNVEGIRPLYYFQAMGYLVVLLIVFKMFRNPHRETDERPLNLMSGMREVFVKGTAIKRWILYVMISTLPMWINTTYIPLFAADVKQADQFVLGGMATASTVAPLLLSIPIGRLADIFGRKRVIYATTIINCLSYPLLVYASDTMMLLASGVLQGFLLLNLVTRGAMTAELVPPSLLGRWYGILGLFRGVVMVIAPIIGGFIWSAIGPAYVFFFLIATEIFKTLILFTVPETLRIGQG